MKIKIFILTLFITINLSCVENVITIHILPDGKTFLQIVSTGDSTDIIDNDFEPENPKQLEELDENTCKWPIGHPNEKSFYFCGRSSLKDFSYCKLHLLYAYQPKGKKEDVSDKEEIPEFIEKKIKSA